MRHLAAAALLLCAACREEPDFDQRYQEAQEKISTKARAIDAELRQRADEADPSAAVPDEARGPAKQQPSG